MSAGKHSISTSRVDDFEDAALHLHTGRIAEGVHGNLDAHANVHGDAEKIDVQQLPVNGSTSQSFTMAGSCFPPRSTWNSVLWPLSERRMAPTCLALTASVIASPLPPYKRREPCRSDGGGAPRFCRVWRGGLLRLRFCLSHLAFPSLTAKPFMNLRARPDPVRCVLNPAF